MPSHVAAMAEPFDFEGLRVVVMMGVNAHVLTTLWA